MKMPHISFISFWKKHSPKEIEDFLICLLHFFNWDLFHSRLNKTRDYLLRFC